MIAICYSLYMLFSISVCYLCMAVSQVSTNLLNITFTSVFLRNTYVSSSNFLTGYYFCRQLCFPSPSFKFINRLVHF